ncbi:hypothetical protein LTR08_002573 [Meristemomyces frigidus]|nr:hypothetical protein LTR08_002573 [Meristemomyces frigidus]
MVVKRTKQKGITFGYCDTQTGQRVYPPLPASAPDLLPEQQPPAQAPAFYPDAADVDMDVKATCYPPLGQVTLIARQSESVRFTVLLETPSPSTQGQSGAESEKPQVSLWHNHNGPHEWSELPLNLTDNFKNILLLTPPGGTHAPTNKHYFTGLITGLPKHAHVVHFTLKFRSLASRPWTWSKASSGLENGELHYQTNDYKKHSTHALTHFFPNLSSDVKVQEEKAETDETYLYSLTTPVLASADRDSGEQQHCLGKAAHCSRWMGLVRLWSPWLAPRHGKSENFELDKDGILLSFLRTDGLHVVCLAVSGVEDVVTTFLSDGEGNVIIKSRNDRTEPGVGRVLVAVADTFEVANAAVWYHARKIVRTLASPSANEAEMQSLTTAITKASDDNGVKPAWLEEWYEGLTYCTWNALGQNLTADKIYAALDTLHENQINITNLIIDDNWQSLSAGDSQFQRAWTDFEANPAGFPEGLKATTTQIRKRHPNVKHIAVWHAILGYWGGVAPDGEIAKRYKTVQVEKESGVAGGTFTVVAAEDAKRMYADFYTFLSSVGVDAVKTDAQFFLDMLLHAPDRRSLITEYQDAWTLAHLRHFSSRAISCMSQSPQFLFHSQLPTNKPTLLVRNSDDFFPEVEASHPWHVYCNAFNSLLTQHLNVLPDWDMFQTSHPWAAFHAAARCVSGGPIYFTDEPGKHDIGLIKQFTAQTVRGGTVILRPGRVGKAMGAYEAYDGRALLKIGTYSGMARTGTGILGIFNVSGLESSREFVRLADFPGVAEDGEYIVGSFASGVFSPPMRSGEATAMVGLEMKAQGWDILTAYPLRAFTVHSQPLSVALLGLVGKMTGSAAIVNSDAYVEAGGRLRIWVSLKALGVLGVYIGGMEKKTVEGDFLVTIFGKVIGVECVRVSGKVLEIDVERAWREGGWDAGWSNEVGVEVFIS